MSPRPKQPLPASFDVLSGLAQELDAPLQSLVQISQKLVDDYKSRDFEYVSYKDFKSMIATLEQMNRQLRRCQQTTARMKGLGANGASPAVQSCQVNDVVKEVTDLLGHQLKIARIRVIRQLYAGLPAAAIGAVECHQVVQNVLVNAMQAMPAGGALKVRTGLNGQMVAIGIEDQGVGITPEHLSKVFEPFFTTKERGVEKSAGLGLSIVYSLVHAAGGDVRIQSSLRKGTTVHIELPVARP